MRLLDETLGLARNDFHKVAVNGWGDRFNAYAYSMAQYNDGLYVGTSRGNLVMIHQNHPDWMCNWPVRLPREFHDFDFRAEIWRYVPSRGDWERVFRSPTVKNKHGRKVPRDLGYRSMTVWRGRRDRFPSLYAATFAPASAQMPPLILRHQGGSGFEAVSHAMSDPTFNTYRILQVFGDCLYTSPTGRVGGDANASKAAVVLETADPANDRWQQVSDWGFGDNGNECFFEMASFNEHLYVGTLNPLTGFQVWKTAGGRKPYQWTRVINNGAGRGNLNELAISMCPFGGALYVGTAIQNGGYDRTHNVGPAAPELIRIHPDDSWDLIVGMPRMTREGLKLPLSGKGPGFNNPLNGYFWRMAVHEGWLYLGTYKSTVMIPYMKSEAWPEDLRRVLDRTGIDEFAQFAGGCELWRTPDGVNWDAVTSTGFENPYNYGIRTLQSTPWGLFVGTANPFGPDISLREAGNGSGPSAWKYYANPNGGLEIWLGTKARGRGMPAA
jgi:hypothetical protein